MYRRSIILVILLLLFAAEAFFARQFYIEIVPFPEDEWWMTVVNNCLRDLLLAGVAGLLYFRRNRLVDRTKRYFPVVVLGVLYLLIAGFMVSQLSLDKGFLTVLAILTGLNNNIVLVLLAAMCYHKWPSAIMKAVYFAVYFFTALTMIFDAFYSRRKRFIQEHEYLRYAGCFIRDDDIAACRYKWCRAGSFIIVPGDEAAKTQTELCLVAAMCSRIFSGPESFLLVDGTGQ